MIVVTSRCSIVRNRPCPPSVFTPIGEKGEFMHWVWLIIVGALVGALGRLFHPGSDPMGWIVTILIGIASLVVAGLIFSSAWLEFIVGVIVALALVAIVGRFFGDRRRGFTAGV